MALNRALVDAYFGASLPPKRIGVALAYGGTEINTPGYERQEVAKGRWQITQATARTSLTFGPFRASTRFDAAWLLDGAEVIEELRFEEVVALPTGTTWHHDLAVRVDE